MKINKNQNYRPDIDGLRAVAILSVVFFHLDFQFVKGGFVGVDIFFTISGFLITRLIKEEIDKTGKFNFFAFYLRRIRRLFPALFATLILTSIAAVLFLSPTHLSRFGGALSSSLLSVSNFYFWLEADYFDTSTKLKPLLHTWSLSVEEQFYFFWPFILLVSLKLKKHYFVPVLIIFTSLISLYLNTQFYDASSNLVMQISLISEYFPSIVEWFKDGRSTIFYLLPFRVFEFGIGALLVWLIHFDLKYKWIYDFIFVAGLGLIAYAILFFNKFLFFPSFYGLIPTIGAAFLMYSGNRASNCFINLLTNKIFVGIGLISYSLYLIHWPIIVFWNYLHNDISLNLQDALLILFVSVLLSFFSYQYIEQPFRKNSIDITEPKYKYSGLISVSLVIFLGISMKLNNGWAWRVTSPVNFKEAGSVTDFHVKNYGGAGYYNDNSSPPDIILTGDSHGKHYAEGLYKVLAKPLNLNLYVSTGDSCFHLPAFIRKDRADFYCTNALKKDLKYVSKGNNPPIIVSYAWLSQMEQADLLDDNGTRKNVKVESKDVIEGLLNFKNLIPDSTLIVIGRVPGAGYNLYDLLTRPQFLINKEKDYRASQAKKNVLVFNKSLKEAAIKTGQFIFLDPHDVLCENNICRNLDSENYLIYSDDNHLSKYGSIEVIKGFLPELIPALDIK